MPNKPDSDSDSQSEIDSECSEKQNKANSGDEINDNSNTNKYRSYTTVVPQIILTGKTKKHTVKRREGCYTLHPILLY